jgi:hypothetical protein
MVKNNSSEMNPEIYFFKKKATPNGAALKILHLNIYSR